VEVLKGARREEGVGVKHLAEYAFKNGSRWIVIDPNRYPDPPQHGTEASRRFR
jgi:hypothetical protein